MSCCPTLTPAHCLCGCRYLALVLKGSEAERTYELGDSAKSEVTDEDIKAFVQKVRPVSSGVGLMDSAQSADHHQPASVKGACRYCPFAFHT